MAVLYILVKFVVLFFHHYYFLYSQAYHSRYMTDDWEFYKKNSAMKLPRLKCEQPYFPIITNLFFNRETQDIIFSNIAIDSNLGFLSVGLRLYSQVISNSQRDFGISKFCSSWAFQFFHIYGKDGKLGFLKTSLPCTSKFFPIH